MTKIDSNNSQAVSAPEPEVDPGVLVDARTEEATTDSDPAGQAPVEDEIQQHEEGFFESLGSRAEALVDEATDSAVRIAESAPDALAALSGASAEKTNGKVPLEHAAGVVATSEELAEDARTIVDRLNIFKSLSEIPISAMEDATQSAAETYEKYVQNGEDPLQAIRNIPEAADRVVENVNDAMKGVFGDDGLEFTLNPSVDDIRFTLEQLTTENSKLRTQARTGLSLAAFEVLRENAGVIEAVADSRTARAISNFVEDRTDTVAAMAVMGLGFFGGPAGMLVGAYTAKQIMTDEIDIPVFGADDLSDLMRDIQSNPGEYRTLIGAAQGPYSGSLDALDDGQSWSKWASVNLKGGKGGVASGSATIKSTATKLDAETFKVDIETDLAASAGIGARLQDLGIDVSIKKGKGAKLSLIFTGPDASKAASSIMRGDLNSAILTGSLPTVDTVELSSTDELSATALKHLDVSLGAETTIGVNTENIVASKEWGAKAGVDLATKFLNVKPLTSDPGQTEAKAILSNLIDPPSGTGFELDAEVSAKAAVEVDHQTGAVELVLTLKAEASRENLDARGTVDIRLTDLDKLLTSTDLTQDTLIELASQNPDALLALIETGDIGIEVDAKAQVRDVESVEADLTVGQFGGSRAREWRGVTFANEESFQDPRLGDLRIG